MVEFKIVKSPVAVLGISILSRPPVINEFLIIPPVNVTAVSLLIVRLPAPADS